MPNATGDWPRIFPPSFPLPSFHVGAELTELLSYGTSRPLEADRLRLVSAGPTPRPMDPRFRVEVAPEQDGRWVAEVPALPGVLAYGDTEEQAFMACAALALRVLADRIEHGEERADTLFVADGRP